MLDVIHLHEQLWASPKKRAMYLKQLKPKFSMFYCIVKHGCAGKNAIYPVEQKGK